MGSAARKNDVRAKEKRATEPRPKTEQELREAARKLLERHRGAFERLGKY